MKYSSTRGDVTGRTFEEALFTGYAADGGLILPETIPKIDVNKLKSWAKLSYVELAKKIVPLYVGEDEIPSSDLSGKFTMVWNWLFIDILFSPIMLEYYTEPLIFSIADYNGSTQICWVIDFSYLSNIFFNLKAVANFTGLDRNPKFSLLTISCSYYNSFFL